MRLYDDTKLIRATVSQGRVETILQPDFTAPEGSHRRVRIMQPQTPILYAVDSVTASQLEQEDSPGAEIGEGLTQTVWPEVSEPSWSIRLRPNQRIRALTKPGSGGGLVRITLRVEHHEAGDES